jgi:hypothetical protein
MKLPAILCMLSLAALACGCGDANDSPTAPSGPTGPSAPPPHTRIVVNCPEFGESSRCTAFAATDRDGQDITGLADWSTSDPAIATINSTGLVTAHAPGEVAIRASYQDATGFAFVWAIPGRGLHGTSRTLAGMVLSMEGRLADALMEILDGPNAGRRMITSSNGTFYMDGLQDGVFTIRLSKPGYVTAEYRWSIPGGNERIPTLTAAR